MFLHVSVCLVFSWYNAHCYIVLGSRACTEYVSGAVVPRHGDHEFEWKLLYRQEACCSELVCGCRLHLGSIVSMRGVGALHL